jgi:hypothetical protein
LLLNGVWRKDTQRRADKYQINHWFHGGKADNDFGFIRAPLKTITINIAGLEIFDSRFISGNLLRCAPETSFNYSV